MRHSSHALVLAAGTAVLGLALLLAPPTVAEDAPAKLVRHPMKDAQPGEYVRFLTVTKEGWKRYSVQTVLEVKDGEAWIEEWQTDESGKQANGLGWNGWAKIPDEIQPTSYQKVVEDEMVQLEVGDQKVWCRHFVVDQPENPPLPEPRVRREAWFTNDVPGWGRVKESQGGTTSTAVAWGKMSDEDLKKAIEARDKREAGHQGN